MTRRVGVGVVGLGVGEQHAKVFGAHPDCRLVALCDMDVGRLDEVAGRMPDVKRYVRADELIVDSDVEIVAIASNDDHHAAQILQALRLGKHVFAEKPLCLTRSELREIATASKAAPRVRLSTNTLLRRSPRFRWLKQAIESGTLGTLYSVEADYIYGRLHKLTSGWRGRIRDYSVMLGGGIHMIDVVLWLSGQRPVEVVAYGSALGSAGSGFAGADLAVALLRFESGLLGKVSANFASVYPHFHRLTAYGTKGTFENLPAAVSSAARLWQYRDGGAPPLEIAEPYPAVGKGDLIPSFVDAVLGRGAPEITEDEAFACVAVGLAIDDAKALGRPVTVEYY